MRYLNRGYQGAVYVVGEGPARVVVKQPLGRGPSRAFSRWMLDREYAAYRRLAGLAGVPPCLGQQANGALVLGFLEGDPFHETLATLRDRERFFAELKELILSLHAAGVAHGDMKRRGNLLVTPDGHPALLDFGASVVRAQDGGAWNRLLFRQLARMDLNAWIKLKYRRRYDQIEPADQVYYQPTFVEAAARVLRRAWRKLTGRRFRKAWRAKRAARRARRD